VKKPLKILYFIPVVHFGGMEAVLLNIIRKLDRAAFEPFVVTGGKGTFTEALDRSGISHCRIRPVQSNNTGLVAVLLNYFPNLILMGKIIDKEKPDLIHDMTHDGLMYLSLVARLQRIPLLWQPHIPQDQIRRRGRIIQKFCCRFKLDFVIFINDYARRSYSSFPLPPWRIVPNSVDLTALMEEKKLGIGKKYQFPEDMKVVGLAARVVPGKGHEEFIKAAGRLIRHERNIRFLIIGDPDIDPPFTGKLRRMIQEGGLEEIVRFTGFLSPVGGYMSCLDLLVLPSHSEIQGMVLLEAMACGVPVVASHIEAIREMIDDGMTGVLVPPGDEESLAKAVMTVLRDREFRDRIVANALTEVKSRYRLETSVHKIAEIYKKLCS